MLEKLNIHTHKKKIVLIYKNVLKWIKDLDVKPETITLVKQNGKSTWHCLGNEFLYLTPKAQATKVKVHKWDYIKLKIFCIVLHSIRKINSKKANIDNICVLYI